MNLDEIISKKKEQLESLKEERFISKVAEVMSSKFFDITNSLKAMANILQDRLEAVGSGFDSLKGDLRNGNEDINNKISSLEETIKKKDFRGKDGVNGKDGKDGKNGRDGKDGSPDTAIQIRNKLESLLGNNRLDAEAIKGLSDFVKEKIVAIRSNTEAAITDVSWGIITGTLSDQADLQSALDGKSDTDHQHTESDITDLDKYTQAQVNSLIATVEAEIITDHGALSGLADDDHSQYHNDSRGDSRYIRRSNDQGVNDIGYEKEGSVDGITQDYITGKDLHNIRVLGHPRAKETGSFWLDTTVTPNVLHIYTDGVTRDIKIDFTTENNELEHQPFDYVIDVWSGNSNQLGANGLPLVQEYQTSIGAYPVPLLIDGGSF